MSFHKIFLKNVSMFWLLTGELLYNYYPCPALEWTNENNHDNTDREYAANTDTNSSANGSVSVRRRYVLQLHDECTAEKPQAMFQ